MQTTTMKAIGLKALVVLSAALLLPCCGLSKRGTAPEAEPQAQGQSRQFFASKADFPTCGEATRDQLFYDTSAKVLYICHSANGSYALDTANLNDLKGDKGEQGDKGEPGDKGPDGA